MSLLIYFKIQAELDKLWKISLLAVLLNFCVSVTYVYICSLTQKFMRLAFELFSQALP